ncbi:MAG TPA: hypothetical protein VG890_07955 [Puia sp.]|nr:hypothetical protein [Puia sp.]
MISSFHKQPVQRALRMTAVSLALVAITALAFASKGGGGDKKKHSVFDDNFTPINTASSFTLKKTPSYSGTIMNFKPQADKRISLNTMITYQRGNTTFILPYQYKVQIGPAVNEQGKTNLQFLGVKIQMPK